MSVVTIKAGGVRGQRTENGVHVFLGIPFAQPPLGDLRYWPPMPVEPWDGVREADHYLPTAPQPEHGFTIIPEPIIPGEDFLNLNVFTPDPGATGLPVLVWIHGGGFVSGCNASPWYRGERFARDGVVVVSVNYRLGAEGFLALEGAPTNRGILDWLAALEWVQDNIGEFGGDPSKVTIAGQSAGGGACATLLAIPSARGLFRAAIPMSGAAQMTIPEDRARAFASKFAAELGVAATRNEFAAVTLERILEVQQRLAGMGSAPNSPNPAALGRRFAQGLLPLGPTVDGDALPAPVIELLRGGAGADLPVLVGNTTGEFTMLAGAALAGTNREGLAEALAAMGLSPIAAEHYLSGAAAPPDALAQAITDRTFRLPSVLLAEARTGGTARTWVYEFDWRSPAMNGALGAGHCLDLPFVWDNLDAEGVSAVAGDAPPRHLADAMHAAWVAFVTDLDPGWPAYEQGRRTTMMFDDQPHVDDDPLRRVRQTWDGAI